MRKMKVAVLTGGGDAPGLNAYLKGLYLSCKKNGFELYGYLDGWKGVLENKYIKIEMDEVIREFHEGGTFIGSSRTNPAKDEATMNKAIENFKSTGFNVLVAIGGEDTIGASSKMHKAGIPVIGLPKTIDYDLEGTEFTVGFNTAVNIVMDAVEKLISTAKSHKRVLVLEVMGRHAGWIALYGGLAGGANYILIPEVEVNIDELTEFIKNRYEKGYKYAVIVVAEGVKISESQKYEVVDEYGHVKLGGIGELLAKIIEDKTKITTRSVNLGHIQRGGPATSYDRIIPLFLAQKAVELIKQNISGKLVCIRNGKVDVIDLHEAEGKTKKVPVELYEQMKTYFV
ncbi:MAG: ATP-dependent 6-phosphofructokinase [Candidatus Calescibacterium sp.]|nr:ATP-dependent 6-phosphofructokinase [Candidatus Calescibacterium sp.]MCX7972261.1 ATP-dependent 6-phosphofructokinase [bacterium]MDW8195137.1 ATP-dependent 6-phosphofructokinase [Candidatus Calescibacterium sp.]